MDVYINKFKVYCLKRGLSGAGLARMADIHPRTIHSYFQGIRRPNNITADKLCHVLCLTRTDLMRLFDGEDID